ncbi:hypothetical protein D9619_011445 [Psilocybe cf. subviscida]|uniref:Uncharacterized protein n=1 Tax=Psilocybe cf. subviscida TaxID=2480587 RepID=A0A8H5F9G2_9AGAR|nr:hypothetical protein D9619_011445 [Psilocybe cf. subviscida]
MYQPAALLLTPESSNGGWSWDIEKLARILRAVPPFHQSEPTTLVMDSNSFTLRDLYLPASAYSF